MTLNLCDFAKAITLLGGRDLSLRLAKQVLLCLRHLEVIHGNRHSSLSGVAKAKVLEIVRHGSGYSGAMCLESPCHQLLEGLLIDNPVTKVRWGLRQCWRSTRRSSLRCLGLGLRLGLGLGGLGRRLAGFRGG